MIDTASDTDPDLAGSETPDPSDTPRSGLLAIVLERESDGRPSCPIYPPDAAAPYRTTTWIAAHGDSFVCIAEWR